MIGLESQRRYEPTPPAARGFSLRLRGRAPARDIRQRVMHASGLTNVGRALARRSPPLTRGLVSPDPLPDQAMGTYATRACG